MERWVGFTGQMAGLRPEVLDKINADKIVEQMATDLGVPNDMVVSEEQVAAQREARFKAEQNAQNLSRLQGAVDAAKGLSDVDTTAGNALGDLVGGLQGGSQ